MVIRLGNSIHVTNPSEYFRLDFSARCFNKCVATYQCVFIWGSFTHLGLFWLIFCLNYKKYLELQKVLKKKREKDSYSITYGRSLCWVCHLSLLCLFEGIEQTCVELIQRASLSAKLYQTASNRDRNRKSSCLNGGYNLDIELII